MCESVENTPGRKAMAVMENVHKEIFKKPTGLARKRRKLKVLDEDSYVEGIANIIQRDFFPDLEKIKAQNAYLDAMQQNDTVKLRELYMKYSGRKPPEERLPSPATFETPANIHNSQHPNADAPNEDAPTTDQTAPKSKTISLDQFLNSHTSQDNESFGEIIEAAENKHREKYSYLYGEEEKSEEDRQRLLELPSLQQQAELPERPFNVNTWGYKNKNYLMYNPDGVGLSREQEIEINQKRQEITYVNTRLKVNPFNEVKSKETINELAKSQARILDGKIGVDGKELLKPETPKIGGFSFVRTPSPSPSTLGTPLMTWGEIEGTPFLLDGSDTPLPSRTSGPSFKMSEPPRREQIAFALAEKVGEQNRDKRKKALDAQRKKFSDPSPRPNTSAVERLATMSPAARRLATSGLKLGVRSDLGPAYSPSRPTTSPNTRNLVRTPTPKRLKTPKSLGIKQAEFRVQSKEVSTDDLLNINLPIRKKASDFF